MVQEAKEEAIEAAVVIAVPPQIKVSLTKIRLSKAASFALVAFVAAIPSKIAAHRVKN